MRYIKVLLLVLLIFFSLVFFFQNQTALSTAMTLKLNLFFVPEMTSIPLPFYFIVIVAFFVGALLAVALLLWDKMHLTARYMKSKWRVSALEREVAKLKKSLDGETARGDFLRKVSQEKAQAIEAAPAKEISIIWTSSANAALLSMQKSIIKRFEAKPEEVTAPDPDKA